MALKVALLAPLALALACGGATDVSTEVGGGGAGAGAGGQTGGGKNGGGSSSAGTSHAGTAHGGVGAGGTGGASGGVGGTIVVGGTGAGGSIGGAGGYYNPSCPAHEPTGACFVPGTTCDYNYFTGCLCYQVADVFGICTQVDPTCTGVGGTAGTPAPPPDLGDGGFTAKVALPPQQRCLCAGTPAGNPAIGGGAGIPAPSAYWICSQ